VAVWQAGPEEQALTGTFPEEAADMAPHGTKFFFRCQCFLVIMYKNGKRKSLVVFTKGKAGTHRTVAEGAAERQLREWCTALVCRYGRPDVRKEYAQERRRLCQKERKDSLLRL